MKKGFFLLKLLDIRKSFFQPNNDTLYVLKGLSLTLLPQNIYSLMGANGSGKTTLMNIICGDINYDSGEIILDNMKLNKFPSYKRYKYIGRVHQESYKSIASYLTVYELISISSRKNTTLKFRIPNTTNALTSIGKYSKKLALFIEKKLQFASKDLSGGERQLLCLAISILGNPKLLLLDEHLASLDDKFKEIANELLLEYVKIADTTALVITHSREWAESISSEVITLQDGVIKQNEAY